jgi:hypothetical protein
MPVFRGLQHGKRWPLNGINSFDYLVELMRHAAEVAANPREWMPWCCRATLGRA